jgi:hypothetical protein
MSILTPILLKFSFKNTIVLKFVKPIFKIISAVSNSATEVQMAIEEINGLIENDYKEEEEFQVQ